MLMSWQPGTHEDYLDKVGPKVVNLGLLYTHARLGWAVPAYIPESKVESIADLAKDEVREKLDGTVTGIDPGAGLTRLSKQAIEDYGLDYELQISSGAGMTAALERAVRRKASRGLRQAPPVAEPGPEEGVGGDQDDEGADPGECERAAGVGEVRQDGDDRRDEAGGTTPAEIAGEQRDEDARDKEHRENDRIDDPWSGRRVHEREQDERR